MVPGVYGVTLSAEMLAADEEEKTPEDAEVDNWRMAEAATRDWTCRRGVSTQPQHTMVNEQHEHEQACNRSHRLMHQATRDWT
jgi:hypothetical protein